MGRPQRSRGKFQRERLQALAIFVEAVDPVIEKFRLRQAVVEDVAGDRRKPDQVGAGLRMQEEIGAARHLVFAQIGDDQLLAAQLVRALDARRQHGMALRRVAADDHHQAGLLDILDRTRIAAVADRAEQSRRRRRLAVARAVIDVVRADHRARQLLHQIAFFVGAFRRGDERERVRPVRGFDLGEALGDQVERLVPRGLAKLVALADQRLRQPVGAVDEIPAELAFDAGGDAVRRALRAARLSGCAGPSVQISKLQPTPQ